MAELAAASGAAGFISLGFQACSGLIQYCDAWKGFDKDKSKTKRRIERLANALGHLESVLASPGFTELHSAALVKDTIMDCADEITELESMCKKYTELPAAGNRFSRATSTQLQRGLYPFRKKDLDALNVALNYLQNNLNTALQVLHR